MATTTAAAAPRVVATTAPRVVTTPAAVVAAPTVAVVTSSYVIASVSQAFGTGVRPTVASLTPISSSAASSTATALAGSAGSTTSGGGSVVGIVVGSLVGVVVLATIAGYGWRKRWGRKPLDDVDPSEFYDRDDLRRQSVRLDDGPGGYGGRQSPMLMSQYAIPGLGRSNTTSSFLHASPPLGYPASPTLGSIPSFSPGQVVPSSSGPPSPNPNNRSYIPSGPPSPQLASFANAQTNGSGGGYGWGGGEGMDMYGSYPVSTNQLDSLDRGLYRPQQFQQYQASQAQHAQEQELRERMQYQQHQQQHYATGVAVPLPLSPLHESSAPEFDNPPAHFDHSNEPSTYSHQSYEAGGAGDRSGRSGTPENSNVQQSYFSHELHSESASPRASPPRIVVHSGEDEGVYNGVGGLMMSGGGEKLGVRNGSQEEDEDVYGGYA